MLYVTESNSERLWDLIVVLVLSIVLVSGLLLWRPWSRTADTWTIVVPQQPTTTEPDYSLPSPDPNNVLT